MSQEINPYGNVSARYLEPPREKIPPQYVAYKEDIPKANQYINVEPRYNVKKEIERKPRDVPPSPFLNKDEHEKLSKKTVGLVDARFFDPALYNVDDEKSPKRQVEDRMEKDERIHGWRNDLVNAKNKTFDDLRKVTDRRYAELPPRKKSQSHSAVKEYIRNGSPISHARMAHITDDGNAAVEERMRRANSPRVKTWHAAGVRESSFSSKERVTANANRGFGIEQRKIAEKAERRMSKKIAPAGVPRVAMLAPSVVVAQSLSRQNSRSGSQRTGPSVSQPARHANGGNSAHQTQDDENLPSYEIEDHPDEKDDEDADNEGDSPEVKKITGTIKFGKK